MSEYKIEFTDHRGDTVKLTCNSFETAEQVAAFLSNHSRGVVALDDGYVIRHYANGQLT